MMPLLDVETGRLLWKTDLGAPVITSAVVTKERIYFCDFAGNIYGFHSKQKQ
jgi:hypothetical protein